MAPTGPNFFEFLFEEGPLFLLLPDGIEQFGVDDDAADLVGDGGDGADLGRGEGSLLPGLDNDDADGGLSLEQGDAEKGMELFLFCFPEVFVAGVTRGILDVDDPFLFDDEAGETFRGLHGDLADRTLGEAAGGLKTEGLAVVFQEVDGTDVGTHPLCHQVDDVVQGFLEIVGVQDQGADVLKCPEPQAFLLFFAHFRAFARKFSESIVYFRQIETSQFKYFNHEMQFLAFGLLSDIVCQLAYLVSVRKGCFFRPGGVNLRLACDRPMASLRDEA